MKYSAAEQVYRDVKERILTGEIPGGELISEGEIATALGVSRTPVREGFLRLEAEGWMRLYPKRGALIVPVAEGEAENVVDARQLVETHAVARLVTSDDARSDLVGKLRRNIDEQQALRTTGDHAAFSAADAEFHRLIVEAGANPLLLTFYEGLRDRQRRMTVRSIVRNPAQLDDIIAGHARLVGYIEAADLDGFATSLSAHMRVVHGLTTSMRGTQ